MDDSPLLDLSQVKPEKTKVLETHIENPVCNYAKNMHGMLAEKFTSPAKRSVPDRMFTARNGNIFFIEFKAPGKKPTAKQLKDHKERRARGARVYVVDDVMEGKQIIDREALRRKS